MGEYIVESWDIFFYYYSSSSTQFIWKVLGFHNHRTCSLLLSPHHQMVLIEKEQKNIISILFLSLYWSANFILQSACIHHYEMGVWKQKKNGSGELKCRKGVHNDKTYTRWLQDLECFIKHHLSQIFSRAYNIISSYITFLQDFAICYYNVVTTSCQDTLSWKARPASLQIFPKA